jgi:hypothetical protein
MVGLRADFDIASNGTFGHPLADSVRSTRSGMVELVIRIPEIPAAQLTTGDQSPE